METKPGSITVVNKYLIGSPNPYDTDTVRVAIHRGTPLGNPFKMLNPSQRDEVCDKYEGWIQERLTERGAELKQFERLCEIVRGGKDLELMCFCAPKRCHGNTIKRLIELSIAEDVENS